MGNSNRHFDPEDREGGAIAGDVLLCFAVVL